ncbi:MAG: hypothetical protein ACLUBZ_16865 [Ruthenibacterium lactatiformans]|uniref:hypothetical protein n=1 Tax=Ruthenibacterium lactatiformans TaxID=1550024 RepID=UPI00399353F0
MAQENIGFGRTVLAHSVLKQLGNPQRIAKLFSRTVHQNRRAKTASHLRTRNSCCRARKITAGTLCGCQGDLTKLCAKISGSGSDGFLRNALTPHNSRLTLSVASLADFPATVTKMLANTQSIREHFC